jgi:hypothetical protein
VEYQRIWWLLVLAVFEYGSMFSFPPFCGGWGVGCGKGVVGGGGYLLAHCWVLRQQELGPSVWGVWFLGFLVFLGMTAAVPCVGWWGCVTGVVV